MVLSLLALVVCFALAAVVFLVAGVMAPTSGAPGGSPWARFRAGLRRLRPRTEVAHRHAVAHHAVGAPSVWVGRPQDAASRHAAALDAPVDMDMDEFFAATIESQPGYVDAEELTEALQRARAQAQRSLQVPLGTISVRR